jgi:hypothetical protein
MAEYWAVSPGMKRFFARNFGNAVQRRGVHVFPPEIGSRDGGIVFGGIQGFYADL